MMYTLIERMNIPAINMDINVNQLNDITIIELNGEIDSVTAPAIQQQILPLAQTDTKLLLDMSNVTYMSSAGLRMLLLVYRQMAAHVGKVVLSGLNEEVRDVMAITGFLDFFATTDSRNEALKYLN